MLELHIIRFHEQRDDLLYLEKSLEIFGIISISTSMFEYPPFKFLSSIFEIFSKLPLIANFLSFSPINCCLYHISFLLFVGVVVFVILSSKISFKEESKKSKL